MHNIESRLVIGPENILFCRRGNAHVNPEILQDVAVKGLTPSCLRLKRYRAGVDRDPRKCGEMDT